MTDITPDPKKWIELLKRQLPFANGKEKKEIEAEIKRIEDALKAKQ